MTAAQYNRRNSTPYVIPTKHQQNLNQHHQIPTHHYPSHHNSQNPHNSYHAHGPQLSASVPTLSREFVVRRISEGETGRLKEELRCEACGKGYKHISSLAKHLWEHTPEWNVTKKLLISKHQQVQLLEAASILVGMNDSVSAGGSRRNSINLPYTKISEEEKPTFKSSYHTPSYHPNYMDDTGRTKDSRSHSISQYPPSVPRSGPVSLPAGTIGGYLDVKRESDGFKTRAMSIVEADHHDEEDHLKSPSSSYKMHHHGSPTPVSPYERVNFDGIDTTEREADDEEEVIGKME